MSFTQRVAESTAKRYESRAAKARSPEKAAKLRQKAAQARSQAGIGPPNTRPSARGGHNPLDPPTVQLGTVTPTTTGGNDLSAVQKLVGVGTVTLLVVGGCALLTGGADDEQASATGYTSSDYRACVNTGDALTAFGEESNGTRFDPIVAESAARAARETIRGASVDADDPGLSRALRAGADYYGDMADAFGALDVAAVESIAADTDDIMDRLLDACRPVLTSR